MQEIFTYAPEVKYTLLNNTINYWTNKPLTNWFALRSQMSLLRDVEINDIVLDQGSLIEA